MATGGCAQASIVKKLSDFPVELKIKRDCVITLCLYFRSNVACKWYAMNRVIAVVGGGRSATDNVRAVMRSLCRCISQVISTCVVSSVDVIVPTAADRCSNYPRRHRHVDTYTETIQSINLLTTIALQAIYLNQLWFPAWLVYKTC